MNCRSELTFERNWLSTGVVLLAVSLLAAGCAKAPTTPAAAKTLSLAGAVHGGQQPVTGATLQLYAAGTTGDGSTATPLLLTTLTTSDGSGSATDGNGNAGNNFNQLPAGFFTLTGDYTCPQGANVYLVAKGGNPGLAAGTNNAALAMMAALGPCSSLTSSTNIFVNELTTVASVAALANYMTSYAAIGSGSGDATQLATAFGLVNEYANTSTGVVPGPTLPASTYASSIEIQTLGDAISGCINSAGGVAGDGSACGNLFTDATVTVGSKPSNVIAAVLNIVKNPTLNVCAIYGLVPAMPPFQPTLTACPASWSLPIAALTVSVSGPSSVYTGQTAQYTAAVTGVSNQTVTWSVDGTAGGSTLSGTISASGLYTPPPTAPSSTVTITATSVLSSSAAGSQSLTLIPVTVSVAGPANVLFGQTGQYTATVTGSSQTVNWLVNGVAGGNAAEGTISTAGVYTAPATAPPTPVTVSAQSTVATTAYGFANVTVSPTALTYATGDTRTVTQPSYPTICATVYAQFTSSQRSSPPAAASDDTARIQAALSSAACLNTGGSVELAASGSNNAFFSELLTVTGEGLTIDSGVTLYGGATYSSGSYLIYITGTNSSLNGLGTGASQGTVDGRGDLLTGKTRLVEAVNANNFIAYNVTLQQSLYPNLYIQGGNGITVWGITVLTPATRANADGIDLDSLTNATVTNSTIEAGDDGVAVKTNSAANSNVTVSNNRLYGTHGLSIGSINYNTVSNILFQNNYVYGSDFQGNLSASSNAIVIKSDPACQTTVQQVTYRNTCISGVKHLITFYTNYAGTCTNNVGSPVFTDVIVNGVVAASSISGAYSEFIGYSAAARSDAALAYISLDANALNTGTNASQYATISLDSSSLTPTGTGIVTQAFSTPGSVPSCTF
jgi:polygalacturonase